MDTDSGCRVDGDDDDPSEVAATTNIAPIRLFGRLSVAFNRSRREQEVAVVEADQEELPAMNRFHELTTLTN
ncbi:unnamed protein product [Nippostrongylus brasiliensis]|uniref:Uncharacterized protein n=1 Tax=Nippostrongylus brasiliensis TaxID=27835 RepID=A0A0N4Y9S3_NIPBR|nr:hypothetical protein Q1695_009968 [Nippostrongylus brasiliensis]VDL76676.1 unnamed protein product [Nippostrongylus brasiliensis]